jgi:putative transposase
MLKWTTVNGIGWHCIAPGQSMQNDFMESLNGKMGDECLNEHVFGSQAKARRIIEEWRIDNNEVRPHSSFAYQTPDEFAAAWQAAGEKENEPAARPEQATGRDAAECEASAPG